MNWDLTIQNDKHVADQNDFSYECFWSVDFVGTRNAMMISFPSIEDDQTLWRQNIPKSIESSVVSLPIINYYSS